MALFTGAVNGEMPARHGASPLRDGCEEIPGGMGLFGRSPDNPVPVDGYDGALAYLDGLRCPDGGTLLFHRIGSFTCRALGAQVVCLEVVSTSGRNWDLLFFSLDHPRASRRVPTGYVAEGGERATAAAGTWSFCPDFPADFLGGALAMAGPAPIDPGTPEAFVRPPDHSRRLARLLMDDTSVPPS